MWDLPRTKVLSAKYESIMLGKKKDKKDHTGRRKIEFMFQIPLANGCLNIEWSVNVA